MKDDENPISKATRMQNQCSPNAVIELWEKAVAKAPNNPNAQFGLGRCYAMQDRYADAEIFFSKAVKGNPNNPIFQLNRFRNSKNFANDIDPSFQLSELVQKFPDNGILRHEAASYFLNLEETKTASDFLKPVLSGSVDAQGWTICKFKNAEILRFEGRIEEAEQELLSILKHQENYGPALNSLLELPQSDSRKRRLKPVFEDIYEKDKSNFENFVRLYRFYKVNDFADEAQKIRSNYTDHSGLSSKLTPSLSGLINALKPQNMPSYFNAAIWRSWRLTEFSENKWKRWSADIAWRHSVRLLSWKYFATFLNEGNALQGVVQPPNIYGSIKTNEDTQTILIAGNHQPPPSLSTRYLEDTFSSFSSLTYSPFNLICQEGRYFGISDDKKSNIKHLIKRLDQGGIIGISPDTPTLENTEFFPFLGGEIRLSTLIPRLVYKRAIPSYALLPYWEDNRYGFDLITLPTPKRHESKKAFIHRWSAAYLSEYEKPLKSSGRLINAQSAAWSRMRFPDQSVL